MEEPEKVLTADEWLAKAEIVLQQTDQFLAELDAAEREKDRDLLLEPLLELPAEKIVEQVKAKKKTRRKNT